MQENEKIIIEEVMDITPSVDLFVENNMDGMIHHRTDYGVFFKYLYGYKLHYLYAHDSAGVVQGVMPLLLTKHWLTGLRLVNMYGSNYGGILSSDANITAALADASVELGRKMRVDRIEYMSLSPIPTQYDIYPSRNKVTMWVPVCSDEDQQWKLVHSKSRNQIRKAQKSECRIESGGVEYVDEFYRIYTKRMRELGTPPYAKILFTRLLEYWPQYTRVFLVRLNGVCVGGGFVRWYKEIMEILWAATLKEYNSYCPNLFMYWEVLKFAIAKKMKWFDLGRCDPDGPTYHFKERLGGQKRMLYYYTWVPEGSEFIAFSPESDRYRWKVALWKKLPLPLTRLVGPWISRGF